MTSRVPPTEQRNPHTADIDTLESHDILRLLHDEDARAVEAVAAANEQLARSVDEAHARLVRGGSVHYFGAGASGRLAVLDATEITPTFGAPRDLFTAHFAGGASAVVDSSIDCEDSDDMGAAAARNLDESSVAVGITASGSTTYVAGALRTARAIGALTILITCNPDAPLRELADMAVVADTGPEALAGSTRLKAGTATKVILNSFSTALMIKSGRTYSNLMVGLVASNTKLRERAVGLLADATGSDERSCREALTDAGGKIPEALVRLLTGCSPERARSAIDAHPSVRDAVAAVHGRAL
ncbi:N-acetylmuramic acid 6-phosphate etherase [Actinobacteria bacterium YIM 96077]|uniref:N-acetylmuramic acid 6-phosphate etherase n=1 Tax=Phytoactinopolyspora halophila TaxID=1981511 RepID=A0A329QSS2_9ACTN|nr:N-acetylmuramic acid 6-phosphate etherase [Phytoactinopolyspora halophila]AYY12344.1 N-acetylmuramic acid 6-phosphate etherase [Actinobacteria bacterium YIM 96077]RAW13738.1 N-acetylmuramic acid 6-phosphate etherase [Phytoactinopolyspora halophila]